MEVHVTDRGKGRFDIQAREAIVSVDLLPADGGAPDGFRSVELLLAGLGACTAGTLRTFAVNQEIAGFEGVDVEVSAETAKAPERVSRIEMKLHIKGDVAVGDVERLVRVAGRCKVHNTLDHSPEIELTVVDAIPAS